MRYYWSKILIMKLVAFLLPFAIWLALDAFVLPPHFFTFRAWEALKVKLFYPTLTGPFYPNQHLELTELGELAPYTQYSVPKRAVWITDQYGYRNRPSAEKPEVLLLGDSFSAGVKLSQEELLSEVMEKQLGQRIYSVAPAPANFALMNLFLATDRFHAVRPRVVVMERNEGYMSLVKPIDPNEIAYIRTVLKRGDRIPDGVLMEKMSITADRFQKRNWYQWVTSRIDRAINPPDLHVYDNEVFTFGEAALREKPEAEVNRLTEIITSYRDTLAGMGIEFVFVPVPNKENVYCKMLPSGKRPLFLSRLVARLRERGVHVVDLQSAFDSAYASGTKLYPQDDGHWNGTAVKIAASHITRVVEELQSRPAQQQNGFKMVKKQ